tara:strand:+ start:629 stop:877 length:249 start_codon:yes stop_codon:yes gene_type:complete
MGFTTYEILIITPRQQPTNESEYLDLIDDMVSLGYTDSEMGAVGYSFIIITTDDMGDFRTIRDEVSDIVNYYGLTLADIYEI